MSRSPFTALSSMLVCLLAAPAVLAQATAVQITSSSQLVPGISAQGQIGDYLLSNGNVRVILDDIPHPHGFANTGGNIIDAATAAGEDRFASLFTMFNNHFGRQGNYDTLTIVNPGGGSQVAQIRVTGVDSEVEAVVVQTDYYLGPNDRHVRIVTTLGNTGPDPIEQLQVGDAIQWGLTTHFAPGWDNDGRNIPGDGHDIGGKTLNVAWVGSDGLGSSYGYTAPSGLIELSNGSSWSDGNVTYLDLPANGGSGNYERHFIVGDGSLSSISDEVFALRGTTTGRLQGQVTEQGTGQPIGDATVTITTVQCLGTQDAVSSTIARTGASGSYAADLEPGTYRVLIEAVGRTPSACLTLTISAGATTTQNQVLSQQGRISWSVTDGSVSLPCKLSILYDPLTAKREGPNLGDIHSLIGGYAVLSPSGSGSTPIPPGNYQVWISHGLEYEVSVSSVTVTAGATTPVNAALARVVDTFGYMSADLHVHSFNSADSGIGFDMRVEQSACEGLELPVPTDHDWHSDLSAAIASTGLGTWVNSFPGNEVTTNEWGHFNGYPVTYDPTQTRNGALDHAGLSPAQIFSGLKGDPKAPVVQVNHPRAGGLGYFDLTALNPVTGLSPHPEYSSAFDAIEVFNGKRLYQVPQVQADWYRLLNNGQKLSGMGNTDTHLVFSQEIGYPRTYVYTATDTPPTLGESQFKSAVLSGRSLFTNGPFVELFVNGSPMGSQVTDTDGSVNVRVRIQAPLWVTVDTLEIKVNGAVAQSIPVPATGAVLRLDQTYALPVTRDSWISAEVRGGDCTVDASNNCQTPGCPGRLDPVIPPLYGTDPVCPYAHTNPAYVDANGNGQYDPPGNPDTLVEPIAATRPVDGSGNNTRVGEVVTVRGIVTTDSYVFNHRSNTVYFQDDSIDTGNSLSGGTTIYQQSLVNPQLFEGDLIEATGTVTQFYGLLEMTGVSVDVLERGRAVPDPLLLTIADLRSAANDEQWEGMLVRVNGCSITGGTWPPFGVDSSITISDGTGPTITMRIDADTDIDGTPTPSSPFDLIAVVGQFKTSAPYLGFYQLLPRQRIDIIEGGSPLEILHGPAADPVTSCGALVRWYTSKPGGSVVEYGLTPSYGSTVTDPAAVLSHAVTLPGLAPSTTYHYRVTTGTASSADHTFTTASGAVPTILVGPVVHLVDSQTVQVHWKTDLASSSAVDYGPTSSYGSTVTLPGDVRLHAVTLSGLTPDTLYHYRVRSASSACGGGSVASADAVFRTPGAGSCPPGASHPVISQVQTGGAGGATDEFIELFNPTSSPYDLTGHALIYHSAANNPGGAGVDFPGGTTIPARGYLLVAPTTYTGSVPPDVTMTSGLSATGGHIYLTDGTATMTATCPPTGNVLVDWVGYGATAVCPEGGTPAAAPASAESIKRRPNDATGSGQDTDDNGADFLPSSASTPRSSQTTLPCGGGSFPCQTITISPGSLPAGQVGFPYVQNLVGGAGTGPYTFGVIAGELPAGIILSQSGSLAGTPSIDGTFNFTVRVTDSNGCTGQRAYTLEVAAACGAITLQPATLPSGTVGVAYSQAITASGGVGPYTFARTAGNLPPGLSLSSGGVLSGTPSASGSSTFTITATDSTGCTGSQPYTLVVNPAGCGTITLAPPTLPNGTIGIVYSQTITASGGAPPYTFAISAGTPPPGLALSPAGLLSGTPTTAGSYGFTVRATDAASCSGTQAYTIVVGAAGVGENHVVGQGLGAPNPNRVRVYTGIGAATPVDFLAYGAGQWGVNVTTGDLDLGAHAEIVTGPGPGAVYGPHVRGFTRDGVPMGKISFFAYGTLRYGVNVVSGGLDADPYAEMVTGAGPGDVFGPHVRGWNFDATAVSTIAKINFFAYGTLKYGVNVAEGSVDADANAELLTGPGPGTIFGPQVRGFNYDGGTVGSIAKINFNAFPVTQFGVNLAGGDVDDDGFAEILTTLGPGGTTAFPARFVGFNFDGTTVAQLAGFDITPFSTVYGGRVGAGDVSADAREDLLAGAGRDPSADSTVRGFAYAGGTLTPLVSTFLPFGTSRYGVNVTAGGLDF